MFPPGPHNDLTDIADVCVGHHTLPAPARSGVTVVVPPIGTRGGVDVRGGAPGTRETDLLDPLNLVDRVDAVVLAGGSAFGLAAADGVMAALEEQECGWPVPGGVVPIVPAAVVFDLGRSGDFAARPDAEAGRAAFTAASRDPIELGAVGAGAGSLAGGLRGGVGSASAVLPSGATVAALVVVNSAGSVIDPRTGQLYAARVAEDGDRLEGVGLEGEQFAAYVRSERERRAALELGTNTTIGVIVTDYALTKARCAKLAGIGHDGLARGIDPVHTMFDGDTLFGLATGGFDGGREPTPAEEFDLLSAAATCVTRAVGRAVTPLTPLAP
ncbi:MAG: P1 family peptidase [Actinomycetia bacterium]|nr:P1 family peptidase [Actinomycetes bacterium]